MKKIFILFIVFLAYSASAQTPQWVSTTPQNQKVLLEEFTGIHCGYCTDGHKIATDLEKSNVGNVYLINIHAGGYATPAAGEPDFRTTVGTAIDAAAGVTGYPAGSVNRNSSPWATNRGTWATKAATVMGNTSPVNVYVKSAVDKDTRMLTTEVEVYYTANGTGSSNKLSVALLQNGILGPQSDYGNYNPTNWVNGKYIHNHVLRQHITTGTWGISLDTVTSGKYYKKTFYTVLPANIASVPLDIYNLEVVAFVSEANNNVLTAHGATVTHNNPNIVDLSMKDSSVLPIQEFLDPNTKWCENKVQPRVVVTNNSATTITSFTMTATVNGVANNKTFTGSLAAGQSTILDWGVIPVVANGYFSYKIDGFTNINGGTTITDSKALNNSFSTTLIGFKPSAFTTFKQTFDSTAFIHTIFDQSENSSFSIVSSTTTNYGAEGTKNAVRFPLDNSWGMSGKPGHIIVGEANLTGITSTDSFSYYYAYSDGSQSGTAPSIKVSYSEDCGTSWTDLNTTTCLQTGQPASTTVFYVPATADYKKVTVPLTSLIGKKCLLRVSGIPGGDGNALYIDQINLKSATGSTSPSAFTDTFHIKEINIASASKTFSDIIGGTSLLKDSVYTWKVNTVSIPSALPTGWKFLTICDPKDCVDYPTVTRKTFTAYGNPTTDIFKITIDHAKKPGYGFVTLKLWKGKDSTSSASLKEYKFSLLTTAGASVGLVSDVNDKLLYYFDNKIFVDREFQNANIEVYDINGKQVLNSKINTDNIDFNANTKGIYIARVLVDGQVAKTLKFSNEK